MYGFARTPEYLEKERIYLNKYASVFAQRDMEWVSYLKSIGGPENLKPAGIFKPSEDLKRMVRRGIPVAFRPLLWQHISLCTHYRARYPKNYYAHLLSKVTELDPRVKSDIEKDVDR